MEGNELLTACTTGWSLGLGQVVYSKRVLRSQQPAFQADLVNVATAPSRESADGVTVWAVERSDVIAATAAYCGEGPDRAVPGSVKLG
jgi:hypothetical protein